MEIILEKSGNFVSPEKLEPCRIQYFSTFAEEGRYMAQTTHVTYATQSAHTYQQTAEPQSAVYAREPAASNSSKYGTTAPSQSAFSSYPSHYAAHQQKTITEAHYPAGYRVPAQAGQHGNLLNTKYYHGLGFAPKKLKPTLSFANISPNLYKMELIFLKVIFLAYGLGVMAHLHCRTWIRIPTRSRIPNQMATLCYAEHFTFHGLRLGSLLSISQSKSIPESVSGIVNEPLEVQYLCYNELNEYVPDEFLQVK